MNKRKVLPVLLVFSLALNSAFIGAWAYHYFFVRPVLREQMLRAARPERHAMAGALAELNLTGEQRRRLMAGRVALRRGIEEPRRRAEVAKERLLDLLAAPEADPEALKAAQQEIAADRAEVLRLVFEHLLRVRDVLSHEQRVEFREMLRGMRGPHRGAPHGQRGPRGESPPPPPSDPNGRHGISAPHRNGVMLYPYQLLDGSEAIF